MRIVVELGPKRKKTVAYAVDWPGLERNGKSHDEAIQHMDAYRPRYLRIAERARLTTEFANDVAIDVVEMYEGTGSTDFWGISFAHSSIDHLPISTDELERQLSLLQACWAEFDEIAERVSSELRKGPRGGGRDRDHIVRHVLTAELDWVRKLAIRLSLDDVFAPEKRSGFHASVVEEIRSRHAQNLSAQAKGGPSWTLRFLVRHLAYHVMDHAWEMEDKDLSGEE